MTSSGSQMSQDDILQNTRSVVQSLEALKNEHASMIRNLVDKLDSSSSFFPSTNTTTTATPKQSLKSSPQNSSTSSSGSSGGSGPTVVDTRLIVEEEISILRNSDEMVHLGISEATVLIQLSNYLQSIEAEKQKIKSQVKRLCQENAWLRDELAAAQKKLQESEQNAAQIEVELSHLKFLKELKKFDEDLNAPVSQQQQQQVSEDVGEGKVGGGGGGYGDDDDEHSTNNCECYLVLRVENFRK
jgi:regulator of replication initiation timing